MTRKVLLSFIFALGLLNLCAGYSAGGYTQLGPTMPPPCPTDGCLK